MTHKLNNVLFKEHNSIYIHLHLAFKTFPTYAIIIVTVIQTKK